MILILFILFDIEHCFCFVVFYSTNKNLLTWASTTVSCSAALTFRSICLSCVFLLLLYFVSLLASLTLAPHILSYSFILFYLLVSAAYQIACYKPIHSFISLSVHGKEYVYTYMDGILICVRECRFDFIRMYGVRVAQVFVCHVQISIIGNCQSNASSTMFFFSSFCVCVQ